MRLAELITRVRVAAQDLADPPMWSDDAITAWLNDAQAEAAIRARLLHEVADPALCDVGISAGTAAYTLHPAMYELTYHAFVPAAGGRVPLTLVSQEWLDKFMPDWRERRGTPAFLLQDEQALRVAPTPDADGTLVLEGYRVPLDLMADDDDTPEIAAVHHVHLVQWALYRGFSMPDMETFDPSRGQLAEAEFTRYFGSRPDADLRRLTREDVPHHIKACWP